MRIPWPSVAFLCLATLAASPTPARAQAAASSTAASTRSPIPNFFAGIQLSDAQQSQLATLTAATFAARDSILGAHASGAALSASEIAALRAIAQRHQAALLATLTADQRATLEANMRAWNAKRVEASAGGAHP